VATRRVLTIPNALSFARIALIPLLVWLIVNEGTEGAGLLLLTVVVSTDWVDGTIARRTGQVTELGKLLDPIADRMVITAALIALLVRGAFPLWAALVIIVRDLLILVAGLILLAKGRRIEVRFIGKVATFALMMAVPLVAWGHFDLPLAAAATAVGWVAYGFGIVEYYVATVLYVRDFREALRAA
jgi:cardiolipin synthase